MALMEPTAPTPDDVTFDDIDITNLDVFAERYPTEWFAFLRKNAPVWKHPGTEGSDGEDFWLVTSYEHITEVHRSGMLYSHQTGPGREGAGGIALTDLEPDRGPGLQMVMTDQPQHTRYRKLVNSGFTPRMVRRLEDSLYAKTTNILDRVSEAGECDFVVDISAELPLIAIAEIIGVPEEDRDKLFDWSNRTIGGQDDEYGDSSADADPDADEFTTAMIEMAMYAHELTDDKRQNPAEDLWTRLTNATVTLEDGTEAQLSDIERDLFFTLLVVAGNETTRNSISKGLLAFLDHPDQWELWKQHVADRNDPLADTMVDEVLRYTSPVNFFRRTAAQDMELGGQQIKGGDKLALWYPSGNRDEKEFADPDRFDITRSPNHHMAFGAGGAHFCLGANLAKLEIKIIFQELAKRMPDIHRTGDIDRLRMNLVDGVKHIPVAYTASPAVG